MHVTTSLGPLSATCKSSDPQVLCMYLCCHSPCVCFRASCVSFRAEFHLKAPSPHTRTPEEEWEGGVHMHAVGMS
eukprot:jgi/Botrbrau1/5415/Bobra.182_1s0019.1